METSTIGRTQFLLDTLGEALRGLGENPPSAWQGVAHLYLVRAILADLQKALRRPKRVSGGSSATIKVSAVGAGGLTDRATVTTNPRFGWVPGNDES